MDIHGEGSQVTEWPKQNTTNHEQGSYSKNIENKYICLKCMCMEIWTIKEELIHGCP